MSGVFHSVRAQFYRARTPQTDDDDLLIRYSGDGRAIQQAIREIARGMDHELMASTETLRGLIDRTQGDARHMAALGLCAGGVALLLAAIGLYGVVAFATAQRTREFAIRMALGATRARIVLDVLAAGLKPVWIGVLTGVVIARAVAEGLHNVLKEAPIPLDAQDPLLYFSVSVLLAMVAAAAMLSPARTAARSQPANALRLE